MPSDSEAWSRYSATLPAANLAVTVLRFQAGDPAIAPDLEPLPNGGRVNLGHLGNTASATRTFPDVNGDGTIDGLDVVRVAIAFAAMSPDPRYLAAADRDFNLIVDGDDLAYVTAFFAQSCP